MRARSFSHVGITVRDFNEFVRFYWDVFRCPLVGVSDQPPDRVRAFFGVDHPMPTCKTGWIRCPGGAVLEIFEFHPHQTIAARPHVLLRQGLRRQPDRIDGSGLHALRAGLGRTVRWLVVQARDVQAVLPTQTMTVIPASERVETGTQRSRPGNTPRRSNSLGAASHPNCRAHWRREMR
jgi:catechol 2,3-dioxygenase-like lactoylglutathione lyase family enzyme